MNPQQIQDPTREVDAAQPAPPPTPAALPATGAHAALAPALAEALRRDPGGFRAHLAAGRLAEAAAILGFDARTAGNGVFWRAFGDALTGYGCDVQAVPAYELALADGGPAAPAVTDPYGIARAETLCALGLGLAARGELAQAELACGQARGLAPHLPALHVGLGRARLMAGKLDGAERVIRHALKLEPEAPSALAALAAVLAARGRTPEALEVLQSALARAPDSRRLLLQKARLLAARGDWTAAAGAARQVLAGWPWSGAAHRILAQAGLVAGDAAVAIPAAAEAAALTPEEPEVFALWSEALRLGGQAGQAGQAARRGLERHPGAARLHAALGLAQMAAGQPAEAAMALREAARLSPEDPVLASNLIAVLAGSGAYDEALERASALLALEGLAPAVMREIRFLTGRILLQQGRASEAAEALAPLLPAPDAAPDAAPDTGVPDLEAMLLHARALRHDDRAAQAVSALRRILALRPGHRGAATELAGLAASFRDWPAAEAALRPAIQAAPEDPELCGQMGQVLRQAGRPAEALSWFLEAHRHAPKDWRHRRACGECLTALQANAARPDLESMTSRALAESWARPKDLAPMAVSLLRQSPVSAWLFDPEHRPSAAELDRLAGMSVLLRLLRATPVPDWPFEQGVLRLRRTLLDAATGRGLPFAEGWLPLAACVADYCWLTDYALAESAEEQAVLEALGRQLAAILEGGGQPAAPLVAMAAAYRHLSRLPGASRLAGGAWSESMRPLLRRHLDDPVEERRLAAEMERLGKIADPVSQAVMAHYDRAPYPRWSAVPLPPASEGTQARVQQSVQQALRSRFPLLPSQEWPRPGPAEILDAGCGTGQFTLELAGGYSRTGLTAIDLSGHALAYAARKCAEAGIGGVRFLQGDILDLPGTGWQFDLVNAVGLLHHLADPIAGWRALTAVTRPGGVQRIGLYSRLGRQPVATARQALSVLLPEAALLAAPGQNDPDNAALRALRPRLLAAVDDDTRAALARAPDFYALGSLRDMLLHVREHVFDLPRIAEALPGLGLEFLGFDLPDPDLYAAYAAFAPDDLQMRDLARWTAFEAENPATFRGMYVFWVRKAG